MGHPFSVTISFVSMFLNGVFDRFPNAKYAFLEAGVGWFLMAVERCSGSYRTLRPINPTGRVLELREGETAADRIAQHIKASRLFVGVEGGERALPYAMKMLGNQAFMFSSDFPHEVTTQSIQHEIEEVLENEELSEADKVALFSKNAARFYGLQGQ